MEKYTQAAKATPMVKLTMPQFRVFLTSVMSTYKCRNHLSGKQVKRYDVKALKSRGLERLVTTDFNPLYEPGI